MSLQSTPRSSVLPVDGGESGDAEKSAAIADRIGVAMALDTGDGVRQSLNVVGVHDRCLRRRYGKPDWHENKQATGWERHWSIPDKTFAVSYSQCPEIKTT